MNHALLHEKLLIFTPNLHKCHVLILKKKINCIQMTSSDVNLDATIDVICPNEPTFTTFTLRRHKEASSTLEAPHAPGTDKDTEFLVSKEGIQG